MEKIYSFQENNSFISKLGVLLEIFSFFTVEEQMYLQLVCKKIYEQVVPLGIKYTKFAYSNTDIWHGYNGVLFRHDGSQEVIKGVTHAPKNLSEYSSNLIKYRYTRGFRIPNDLVIVIGGNYEKNYESCDSSMVFEYNMDSKMLKTLTPMKYGRSSFGALIDYTQNLIYVIGGSTSNLHNPRYGDADVGELDTVEAYNYGTGKISYGNKDTIDFKQNKWNELPSMIYGRANPVGLNIDQYIYIFGGFNYRGRSYYANRTFERYLKGSDYWERIDLYNEVKWIFSRVSSTPFLYSAANKENDQIIIFGGWSEGKGFIKNVNLINKNYFIDSINKINTATPVASRNAYYKILNNQNIIYPEEIKEFEASRHSFTRMLKLK